MPKRVDSSEDQSEIHPIVLDNFVKLQNVLSNLAVKMDLLTRRIDDLVTIFENASKSFSEQDIHAEKKTAKKIDLVLDQNKTIARGISILEERTRNQQPQPTIQPQQKFQQQVQSSIQPQQQFQPSQEEPRFRPKPLPRL